MGFALGPALSSASPADTWDEPDTAGIPIPAGRWNATGELDTRLRRALGPRGQGRDQIRGFLPGLPIDGWNYFALGLRASL